MLVERPTLFCTVNLLTFRCIKHILGPNFEEIVKELWMYEYFQRNNARAHGAENSLPSLRSPFDEQIINTGSRHVSRLRMYVIFTSREN
jgi:hypothetical protein